MMASYLPEYTALNAWDMLSDIAPALKRGQPIACSIYGLTDAPAPG